MNRFITSSLVILFFMGNFISIQASELASGSVSMENVYFTGHKKPDTDSIVSAVAAAEYFGGIAARPGEVNRETEFLFKFFGLQLPELVADFTGKRVVLVDHNQRVHTPTGVNQESIQMIIDHHYKGDDSFTLPKGKEDIEIVGSTATKVAEYFFKSKRPMSKGLAGLLLGALCSDTRALRSPNTTDRDRTMLPRLSKAAGVPDAQKFAYKMFEAKSNIKGKTARQIIEADYKSL